MPLGTLGTNATNTLSSIVQGAGTTGSAGDTANIALLNAAIKDDLNVAHPRWPTAYTQQGLLMIPNRGILKVLPGDYIAVDATGWPILVSANAIASLSPASSWTHS